LASGRDVPSPFWKAEYENYLSRLRKKNQAIVATAWKMLVAMMLLLAWSLKEETRMGLSVRQISADIAGYRDRYHTSCEKGCSDEVDTKRRSVGEHD